MQPLNQCPIDDLAPNDSYGHSRWVMLSDYGNFPESSVGFVMQITFCKSQLSSEAIDDQTAWIKLKSFRAADFRGALDSKVL